MKTNRRLAQLIYRLWFVLVFVLLLANADTREVNGSRSHPVLMNACVVSSHVQQLVDFYKRVLLLEPRTSTDDYAEFATGVGVLALFSATAQEKYIPGSAQAGQNKTIILEFRVTNVDAEYERLQSVVKTWVKRPTTQPWGTRSIYFRDPDGNLVDFWMPARR